MTDKPIPINTSAELAQMRRELPPRWRATWRKGEQDYLIERGDDDPIVVVRPRLAAYVPPTKDQPPDHAEALAKMIELFLNGDVR